MSHSKRIINNFIHSVDGFRKSSELFDKLDQNCFVGDELGKDKSDCGNGGIIYGIFLVPKIKCCLVLNNDYMLEEKKTFKGYIKNIMKVED